MDRSPTFNRRRRPSCGGTSRISRKAHVQLLRPVNEELCIMHSVTIALLAFLVIALPSAAEAKRAALVIGNSAYVHASMLANPKNDATDFAAVLAESGFEVDCGVRPRQSILRPKNPRLRS